MRSHDHIEVVEAAYALELDHGQWQQRLTDLICERWGDGVFSYVYDASDLEHLTSDCFTVASGTPDDLSNIAAVRFVAVPADHVRALYRTAPHLKGALEAIGPEVATAEWARECFVLCPASQRFALGLGTLDPSGHGLLFAMASPPDRAATQRERDLWGQLASHIAIAHRLRRALAGVPAGDGEAVLDTDGRCLHAEDEARSAAAREVLRHSVRQVMRARSAAGRRDPDQALEIWRGLVDGRWSLIDRIDSDGKHYLIAHRNPPEVRDHRALTRRESQVSGYLAMGLSNKLIGYALGLSTSAVADHVSSIKRKLRASSRVELVRLLGALGAMPEAR